MQNDFLDWCRRKKLGINFAGADFDKLNLPCQVVPLSTFKSNPTNAKKHNHIFKQNFY